MRWLSIHPPCRSVCSRNPDSGPYIYSNLAELPCSTKGNSSPTWPLDASRGAPSGLSYTPLAFSLPSLPPKLISPSSSRTMLVVVPSPEGSPPSSTIPVSLLIDALLTSSPRTPSTSSTRPASHSVLISRTILSSDGLITFPIEYDGCICPAGTLEYRQREASAITTNLSQPSFIVSPAGPHFVPIIRRCFFRPRRLSGLRL